MLKVFVIEDDYCIREPFSDFLSALGHNVIAAKNPEELPFCKRHFCTETQPCCDALITDNLMPKMTGLEFITKQINKGCKLPARNRLLISGSLMDSEIKQARELGITFAQKPVTFDFLEKWIESIDRVPRSL